MNVVDVHNHVNPRPYLKAMRAGRDWYGFTADHGELENPRNHWTLEQRIADMDRLGVDMQALTVYGGFNKYDRDLELTKTVIRTCND